MKFVPLSESDQNQTEEGGKTLKFVPLAGDTKPQQFVPLKSGPAGSDFDVSDPMGTSLPSAIASAPPRKKESVLEGMQMPAPLPTEDKMLRPEFVAAVESRLNALPANKRQAALERMTQRTDVYGRAAKVVAGRYAALDAAKGQAAPLQRLDPRLEAQTLRFIDQGMEPEAARNLARQQAQMGEFRPDLQQMRPDIEGEIADREAARRRAELEGAGFLGRVGAEAKSQATLGGLGLMQVYADLTGDKQMQRDLEGAGRMEEAGAAAIPKGEGVFERSAQGAIASLATQTPMIALSVLTGTAAPVLIQAGVQQFGSSYGEARRAGLSPEMAATRAAPMAAAEVIFERFGMESALAGLRKFVADKAKKGVKVTGNEIAEYFGKAVAKEIPPELATTATQYGIDILPGIGLNRNPSLVDLYQQLEETLRQTVIQAGTTAAVAGGATKGAQKLAQALTPKEPSYKRDVSYEGLSELLARSKGFLVPETQREQAPPAVPPVDLGPVGEERPGAEEPTFGMPPTMEQQDATVYEQEYNTLLSRGIPPDSADRIAKRRVEEARKQRIRDTIVKPTDNEIQTRAKELIDAGVDPAQAIDLAAQQISAEREADEIAEGDQERVGRFEPLDVEPTGAGVAVAGQPGAGTPAAGVGDVEPTGVVSAGQAPATVAGREEAPPTPVDEHPAVQLAREMAAKAEAERGGAVDLGAERARQTAAEQTVASDFAKLQELAAQGRVDASEVVNIQNMLQRGEDPAQVAREIARVISEASKRQAPVIEREEVGPQEVAAAANEPKKRGRPAVLTEEEKQQRAEAKRPLNAQKMRADRAVARLNKTLDTLAEPFDPGEFDSDEEAAAELEDRKGQKRKAIQELLTMQSDPALRGTKVAERIKAALAHPSITPKELADLKAGLEAVKRAEGTSRATVTRGKPDPAFSKFTNGAQALSHIIKTGSEFQKMLGKRLRAFVGGVKFVVIEEGQELPAQLQKPRNARQWERSIALYIENYQTGEKVIYVRGESFGNDQGVNNVTILHELLHAATNRKIMLAIDAIQRGVSLDSPLVRSAQDLLRTMNSAIETYNDMASKGQLSGELVAVARSGEALTDPREFIAYGMTDEAFQQFLMKAKGQDEDTAFFTRFVRGIRELFGMAEDTTNALSDLIKATDSILSSRAPRAEITGEVASSAVKELPGLEQVLRPLPPVLVARGAKTPSLKRRIDALRRRRDAGQLTDTQFAEEVDAIAETVESAKYQKIIPTRQRGADYIRQRILEAKRRGDISEEAADLAEWFILQNPALVDDLSISFRQQKEGGVGGEYLNIPRIARIIKENGNTGTIVHEVLHHLERMMPEPIRNAIRKEWYRQFLKAQDKAADDNQKKFFELLNDYHSETGVEAQFKAATTMLKEGLVPIEFYQYVNPSEFWAVNGTRIVEGNFAGVQGGLLTKLKNWLANTAQKLKGLFGLSSDAPILKALDSLAKADGKFVSTKLLQEEGQYFSVIPEDEDELGRPIRTEAEMKQAEQKAKFAVETSRYFEELAAAPSLMEMRNPDKVLPILRDLVRRRWIGMSDTAVKALLASPTFTFLADWSGIPSLKDVAKIMQLMNGMSNQLLVGAQKVIAPVEKALNPFFFAGRKANLRKNLENLVFESTIARYDPADPNNKEVAAGLDRMYAELGAEGQKLYKMVRDYYNDIIEFYSDILDQQIENLQGASPEVKQNLMLTLRRTFETEARIKPYFPLIRYGDFWARIQVDEEPVFLMFENKGDRNTALEKFAEDRGLSLEELKADKKIELGEGTRELRMQTQGQSAMLTQMFDALDSDKTDLSSPDAREALKDAIYQIYLTTLPEQSFRNQFIRRKDRFGFSTDLVRNMATAASKMSYQMAKLKYAPMLRNSMDSARDVAKQDDRLQPFVNEAQARVDLALKGPSEGVMDAIAGTANKVGFLMFLSSAASALVQPFSLYIAALPIIGANNNNMAGAAKELMRAVGDIRNFGVMTTNADGSVALAAPSLANSDNLTADERDAVRAMEDRGLARNTYASLVWQRQGVSTDYDRTYLGRAKKLGKEAGNLAVGALMHNVERLTREAVFLAAYRVARKRFDKQGYSPADAHLAAIDQAANDVNESLADYDMTNRPRWMQTALGKVAFQFKMFPLHMVLLLGTNFLKMMPFLNKEGKSAAAKKFFGIILTTASVAGASGVPVLGSIISAVAWLTSQALKAAGKEDEDDELRKLDPMLWFRTVFLPEQLGEVTVGDTPLSDLLDSGPLNALTGAAIAERVGLADIFGRDTKEARSSRESLQGWVFENLGPTASIALSLADARDAWALGDYQKAIEKISPAVIRNPILAKKMAEEGIKDANGQLIADPEQITAWQLFMQGIGFRPAFVARATDSAFKLTSTQQKILNQKKLVLGRIKVQARKQTEEGDEKMQDIIENELVKFNDTHPTHSVDATELKNVILQDAKDRASSRFGFKVNKKNIGLSSRTLDYLEERADRELRKKDEGK